MCGCMLMLQVAHQVDLLDSRVKQEQQSTLQTLQAMGLATPQQQLAHKDWQPQTATAQNDRASR